MNQSKYFIVFFFTFLLGASALCIASQYNIKQMTPAIQQAFKARHDRLQELQNLKKAGLIGEDNRGYVAVLKKSATAEAIAAEENRDRQIIYRALVEQNQLGPEGIDQVELAFAEVQREKASFGDFVQLPSGEWIKKSGKI